MENPYGQYKRSYAFCNQEIEKSDSTGEMASL